MNINNLDITFLQAGIVKNNKHHFIESSNFLLCYDFFSENYSS
jgi:hypothetical protein